MKNRVLNGVVMTFHSIAFWISAAFIVRMIIAVVKVFEIGDGVRYGDTFGDVYSVLLLFIAGFLSYRKHTGLSVSVNLSPYKMILSLTLASLCVAMMFVLFDMTIVKQYFGTLDDSDITSTYWEELFPHGQLSGQLFSANGALSFFKLTLIYQTFILTGYCTKHSAFCISNSVSEKYRVYSLLAVTASISLLAALLNTTAHAFLEVKVSFSSIELFRFLVIGGVLPYNNIAATLVENIFFYILVIVTGYFLGSIRMKKGDGFTLLMLLISAAVVFGFAWLGTITFSPAAWLCILPAIMLRTRVTAILLYIIITAVLGFLIHLIFNGTTTIFRRDKNENA